jgi:hypothetical protein
MADLPGPFGRPPMDEPMHATPTADMELEMRLDAYARARLSLTPGSSARIRNQIMGEAHRTLGAAPIASTLAIAGSRPHAQTLRTRARLRRGGALLLAAGLGVGVLGGTAAAAQPGGALYGARMWVETVTLPADPAERATAELRRLEARLTEIAAAARSGDRGAVAAAIAAYGQIADEALGEAGTDVAILDRLRAALDRHLAVLRGVAATAPSQAQDAIARNIERAVEHNDATISNIVARTPPPNASGGGTGGTSATGGTNGGNPGANPAGGVTPDETPAATPDKTKKPRPTPPAEPATTPEPPASPPAATPSPPSPSDHPSGGGAKPSPKAPGGGNPNAP